MGSLWLINPAQHSEESYHNRSQNRRRWKPQMSYTKSHAKTATNIMSVKQARNSRLVCTNTNLPSNGTINCRWSRCIRTTMGTYSTGKMWKFWVKQSRRRPGNSWKRGFHQITLSTDTSTWIPFTNHLRARTSEEPRDWPGNDPQSWHQVRLKKLMSQPESVNHSKIRRLGSRTRVGLTTIRADQSDRNRII